MSSKRREQLMRKFRKHLQSNNRSQLNQDQQEVVGTKQEAKEAVKCNTKQRPDISQSQSQRSIFNKKNNKLNQLLKSITTIKNNHRLIITKRRHLPLRLTTQCKLINRMKTRMRRKKRNKKFITTLTR